MKKNLTLLVIIAIYSSSTLQSQSDSLRIIYDATKGGTQCTPTGATKMYMHSGAGLDTASHWDIVVGDWGIDNGIGQMGATGTTDLWKKTIHLYNYYSVNPANDTIFNIAATFRNHNASLEGRDYSCNDIYFKGLNSPFPFAEQGNGGLFDGISLEWVNPVGGEDILEKLPFMMYPNPVKSGSMVSISVPSNSINRLTLYDISGKEIKKVSLEHLQLNSIFYLVAADSKGINLQPGIYLLSLSSSATVSTVKLIVSP